MSGKYDGDFTDAYTEYQQSLRKSYGRDYFRWNWGYSVVAVSLTVLAVLLVISNSVVWTVWHTALVLGLAGVNLLFLYLMPAPTEKGQLIRTEIEGFKLYLETAEKLHLNAVEPGSDAPPPMTTERYERFLPYAVALGVEKPWSKHFEKIIPEEARNYQPHWSTGRYNANRSISGLTTGLVGALSSGVSSSLPQSSSSSGGGGGGFSGGGGGGGGGGGW